MVEEESGAWGGAWMRAEFLDGSAGDKRVLKETVDDELRVNLVELFDSVARFKHRQNLFLGVYHPSCAACPCMFYPDCHFLLALTLGFPFSAFHLYVFYFRIFNLMEAYLLTKLI